MSKNNTIRKSDKKFIAREKGRIRAQFSDIKKQEELIDNLYKKFLPTDKASQVKEVVAPKAEVKKEVQKAEAKPEVKREKVVKKAKAK